MKQAIIDVAVGSMAGVETKPVKGVIVGEGVAVTKDLKFANTWVVTHIPTGRKMGPGMYNKRMHAIDLANKLVASAANYGHTWSDVTSNADRPEWAFAAMREAASR